MRTQAPLSKAYTGALWRPGLPPGVYEERPVPAAWRDVRMDVTAFLGLAERGPLSTPVPVTSHDEYLKIFGAEGSGRLLGDSVRAFFGNGGRKAVILRVIDAAAAQTARWTVPALISGGAPLTLSARNPGVWGNRLAMRGLFRRRRMTLERPASASPALLPFEAIATTETDLAAGSLVRVLGPFGSPESAVTRFVTEVLPGANGKRVRFDDALPVSISLVKPPPADPADRILVADEITLDLDVEIDRGAPHALSESWRAMGLSPAHPRFFIRLLGRQAWSERFSEPESYDPARPDHADFTALERERAMMPFDPRKAGSELVRPEIDDWLNAFLPGEELLRTGDTFRVDPVDLPDGQEGSDAETTTARAHFFTGPAAGIFGEQPAPLASIERYDSLYVTEPVSLVAAPDLAHPRQYDDSPLEADPEPEEGTRFRDCDERMTPPAAPNRVEVYPLLALSHDLAGLADAHDQLREWCDGRDDTVAILDLPPAMSAGEIIDWRTRLTSDRVALYAPYLEVDITATQQLDRLILPPCGAVCGVIARKERETGWAHYAAANERIESILRLYDDPRLPESGFLHAEHINAVRVTERGPQLLGQRTTSDEPEWAHLSVRRLVDYLKRQIALDLQWATFEPNNHSLWRRIRRSVEARLSKLYEANAFTGRSSDLAYFVRCDSTTMSQSDLDSGRLVCLIGVAPAVPMEFIVFRLTRLSEGGFAAEDGA